MESKEWMNHRYWFYAFILLIILILVAIIYVFTSISDSSSHHNIHDSQTNKDFTISMKNDELQSLMNASLDEYNVKTKITKKTLTFDTTTEILGKDIDVSLKTKPIKENRNTIKFDIKSINIGKLNISNPFILSQIKKFSDLPQYIDISPKDESIYLSLDKLDIDNVKSVQIQKLDISSEKWYFDIKLK
nr:YpmS family protein [Mammaliicoccus sp. Marseille-Q6498]